MTDPIDLPPEIEQVTDLLSKQRSEVREVFRYALVRAMIDDEKACVKQQSGASAVDKYIPQAYHPRKLLVRITDRDLEIVSAGQRA